MGKTVTFKGNPKQLKAIDYFWDDTTTEILFGGGAGGGKTYLGSFLCIMSCLKYAGSISIIGGKEVKKLKDTVIPTLMDVMRDVFDMKLGRDYRYNSVEGRVTFMQNGSFILLKDLDSRPSDPDYMYIDGYTPTFAYIDEVSGITKKAKDRFKGRIRYRHDEYGITCPKLLMTCNPSHGWLKTEFYDPHTKGDMPEDKKFIQSLVTDNVRASKGYIDKILKKLPENLKRVYLYGDWEYYEDSNALMGHDAIKDAFHQNLEEDKRNKYISVDIAGKGADRTVALVFYGKKLVDYKVLAKNDAPQLVSMVKELASKHGVPNTRIVMDADGMGFVSGMIRGVYQFMANRKAVNTNIQGRIYKNLKSQCYFKLAQVVNDREIDLSLLDGLHRERAVKELMNVQQKFVDKDAPLQIEPKDKMKEKIGWSPDYSDALAMGMFFQLKEFRPMQPLSNYGFGLT